MTGRSVVVRKAVAAVAVAACATIGMTVGGASAAPPRSPDQAQADCAPLHWCVDAQGSTPSPAAKSHPTARTAAVGSTLGLSACDDDPAAFCGTIQRPADYRHPSGAKTSVAFRYIPHTSSGPAISTIAEMEGGAGISTTLQGPNTMRNLLGDTFGDYDLLFVDQRGRGLSNAIDCPALQQGIGEFAAAVRACATQLGASVNLYGSAYDARDLDAVRARLGIAKLDLFGISYGAMDAIAYAARFGSHIRSIVLSSGAGPAINNLPQRLADFSAVARRYQSGICSLSVACKAEKRAPLVTLALAAAALAKKPLVGDSVNQFGETVHVKVTPSALAYASILRVSPAEPGWVAAAALSYLRGDPAPLLRVGAIADAEMSFGDSGPATEFSVGANFAQGCADDTTKPWRDGLTYAQRIASARAAASASSPAKFFPWTVGELFQNPSKSLDGTIANCVYWPDTHVEAPLPAGAKLPNVPVLALVASYDAYVPQEESLRDVARFPNHQVVKIPTALHTATDFRCGPDRVQEFYRTLGTVKSTCDDPNWPWYVQPSYPLTSAGVNTSMVKRAAGDQSTPTDRRVAQTVWRTVLDGWLQTANRQAGITNPGIRGGTLVDSFDDNFYYVDFANYRFTRDVTVNGRLTAPFTEDATFEELTVTGPSSGTLTLTQHIDVNRNGELTITGTLGGRHISLVSSSL